VSSTCHFYQALIVNAYGDEKLNTALVAASENLFRIINPTHYIQQTLKCDIDPKTAGNTSDVKRFATLEICWVISSTRSNAVVKYLQESHILEPIFSNPHHSDKTVRNRKIEILSKVVEWVPNPAEVLSIPIEKDSGETDAMSQGSVSLLHWCFHRDPTLISIFDSMRRIC
jgi:hypothetical protein